MTASIDWSDNAITRLRALWDEGHSTAEIGRRMGITKNAVVGKAHRLDLPGRPSPIKAADMGTPRPARAPKATLPALASADRGPPPASPPAGTPSRPGTPAPPPAVPYRGPSGKPCCWPLGEPGRPDFRFCEAGTAPGKPYCPEHASLAYVSRTDRGRPGGAGINRLIRTLTGPA